MNREEARKGTLVLVVAIVLLSGAVFILDLLLPLGVADGVLYVAPVALSLRWPGPRHSIHVGLGCGILTILGFFLSPPGNELLIYVLLNRAYSIFAIGMIVLIGRLQRQLVRRNKELASQAATLEALYDIGTGLSALLDAGSIKQTAVRKASQLFASDAAGLALLTEAFGEIRWHLLAGTTCGNYESIRLRLGQGLVGQAIQSGQPMMVGDAELELGSEELAANNPVLAEAKLRAVLVVPVQIAGKPIGALMVGYRAPRSFDLNDVKLLTGLGNQVAVAINNANLHEKLRALSALEERQRLAREMHDGLAQLLGNLAARATAAGEFLAQGKLLDAQDQFARLREVAQSAYADVRQSIFGLRTPSSHLGLLEALNEYVHRINEQDDISIRIESSDEARVHKLPPAVEVQTIRIIQEAISNVRKHSQATTAHIELSGDADWLTVTVRDDGQGFDLAKAYNEGGRHFGLQMMRERAEAVGGRLTVDTSPGKGTSLVVQLPMEREE